MRFRITHKENDESAVPRRLSDTMEFDGYRGRYVFHCHNLEHENMMMMANFEVV